MSTAKFGSLSLKNTSYLEWFNSGDTFSIQMQPPALTASYVLTLPLTAGTTGQGLTTDGSGVLSWSSFSLNPMTTAGDIIYGGAAGAETRLAAGTANQVLHSGTTPSWSAVSLTADVSGVLPLANGGTNATSASTARTSLGAAASGANSDITSLSGLTTPLSVAQGGTGDATLTLNGVLFGNGTSAVGATAAGTTGQVLTATTGSAPTWVTPTASPVTDFKNTWITADTATKAITHSLGTTDVMVQIYDISSGASIEIDSVVRTDANTLTVTASSAPPATSWRVLILALN